MVKEIVNETYNAFNGCVTALNEGAVTVNQCMATKGSKLTTDLKEFIKRVKNENLAKLGVTKKMVNREGVRYWHFIIGINVIECNVDDREKEEKIRKNLDHILLCEEVDPDVLIASPPASNVSENLNIAALATMQVEESSVSPDIHQNFAFDAKPPARKKARTEDKQDHSLVGPAYNHIPTPVQGFAATVNNGEVLAQTSPGVDFSIKGPSQLPRSSQMNELPTTFDAKSSCHKTGRTENAQAVGGDGSMFDTSISKPSQLPDASRKDEFPRFDHNSGQLAENTGTEMELTAISDVDLIELAAISDVDLIELAVFLDVYP